MVVWYIFPFWYFAPRKIWQLWSREGWFAASFLLHLIHSREKSAFELMSTF
jgi:hypothetical protein